MHGYWTGGVKIGKPPQARSAAAVDHVLGNTALLPPNSFVRYCLKEALIKSGAQDAGISYADVVRFFVRSAK